MKNKEIEYHYNKTIELAINEIKRLVCKILKEHSNLKGFIVANGTVFFQIKIKGYSQLQNIGLEERSYLKPLDKLFSEWNYYLKLTGIPMKFTSLPDKIIEWQKEDW